MPTEDTELEAFQVTLGVPLQIAHHGRDGASLEGLGHIGRLFTGLLDPGNHALDRSISGPDERAGRILLVRLQRRNQGRIRRFLIVTLRQRHRQTFGGRTRNRGDIPCYPRLPDP